MKVISQLLPFLLLIIPLIWGLYGYFKSRGVRADAPLNNKWILVINSAVLYALAFNIIFFIQELFLALGKRWLGLKATLYHNNHNWEGSDPMDDLAQGSGALAIFITGLIGLLIINVKKPSVHWSYVLLLWLAFQGLAQSLPQFITAMIAPDTDTGQAFAYLKIGNGLGLVISAVCTIAMLWLGVSFSRYFLQLAPSGTFLATANNRFRYLFYIALLASLLGIILIIPFRITPWDRAIAPVMVTLISVPMVFAHGWKVSNVDPINSSLNHKIIWLPLIMLVLLLLIFQLVLAPGIEI